MMKPRSAPVTSIAESSTSASTSSSTRPDPSARNPSSRLAMWRSSVATEIALRSCVPSSSRDRKTISTPSESPRRIRSPWERTWLVALVPFTNVPNFESQSRTRHDPLSAVISACCLETPVPATRTSLSLLRPSVMTALSMGT
jgi:hypothetical protein